ncbi:KinB-signaling pathway activation protein [Marinicrinis sediminis]|uniref:KinB-signaling pathway activation protein n=1 Tax=Marinicrinis sediminis TaxID=1652465 RepID=A0ABW5RBW1_9BACL
MNIRKWFYLFWTTLAVGMVASVLTVFVIQITDPNLKWNDLSVIGFSLLFGATYSALSQMGFFAYLTLNFIARGMFKPATWRQIQWVLIIITFVDVIVLRAWLFEDSKGWAYYAILPVVLGIISWLAAKWKSQMTNASAFTPTLFFLFAVTIVEAVPALRQNNMDSTINMMIPLMACNLWQILILHRLLGSGQTGQAGQDGERARPTATFT